MPAQTTWDAGYERGYRFGYDYAVNDTIGVLADNGHTEAADYLRSLLSPEGRREADERLRALYGSLQALAREERS